MKRIAWLGTSLEEVRAFPVVARCEAGYQLDKVQRGLEPTDWKPMKSVGPGVKEIRIREERGQYRVIYIANTGDSVYVLHAFQKKSQKTSQLDIQVARRRLREIRP